MKRSSPRRAWRVVPMILVGSFAVMGQEPGPSAPALRRAAEGDRGRRPRPGYAPDAEAAAATATSSGRRSPSPASSPRPSRAEDSPEYYRVLEDNLFKLKARDFGPAAAAPGRRLDAQKGAEPEFTALRQRVRMDVEDLASLYRDPAWQRNFHRWLQEVNAAQQPLRIIGGEQAAAGELPDCVAVGSDTGFCCSGTLIGRDLVVTAAHCVRGSCASRVYIGVNSNQPATGRVVKVRKAIPHPDYNPLIDAGDVALLVLDAPGRRPAPEDRPGPADRRGVLDSGSSASASREFGTFGVQMKVDTIVASGSCGAADAQQRYGCNAGREIVAGGNGADSCNGDSGGPAYVRDADGKLLLAGATSRAAKNFLQALRRRRDLHPGRPLPRMDPQGRGRREGHLHRVT